MKNPPHELYTNQSNWFTKIDTDKIGRHARQATLQEVKEEAAWWMTETGEIPFSYKIALEANR